MNQDHSGAPGERKTHAHPPVPTLPTHLGILEASILRAIPHAVMGLRERIIVFANDAVETFSDGGRTSS